MSAPGVINHFCLKLLTEHIDEKQASPRNSDSKKSNVAQLLGEGGHESH